MRLGHVVFVDSNPANVVGIFFTQNFPGGKTSLQAATDFANALSGTSGFVPSDVREATVDDYSLINSEDINL